MDNQATSPRCGRPRGGGVTHPRLVKEASGGGDPLCWLEDKQSYQR